MAVININGFDFCIKDSHGDTLVLKSFKDKTFTVSTQNDNTKKCGSVVTFLNEDAIALRDWLNKEYPNA